MDSQAIDRLWQILDGWVTLPADSSYDAERTTFNATIDRRPAAIVRARSTVNRRYDPENRFRFNQNVALGSRVAG